MRRGECGLAIFFGLLGILWIAGSRDLRYMGDFAPGPGFLPFWLGVALVALVVVFIAGAWRGTAPAGADAPAGGSRKAAAIVVGLFACIAAVGWLGFAVSVGAYLLYLVKVVERRGWAAALGVSIGAALGLLLVFRGWLNVPLPRGPWGF